MPRDGFSRKYGKAELALSDAFGPGGAASHRARDKGFLRRYNFAYECIL